VHYIACFIHGQTYMKGKLQNPIGKDLWTPWSEGSRMVGAARHSPRTSHAAPEKLA
jgi:hypothetical protein